MGIFDVFKTKVSEAADKAGDVAGQAKNKVSDMMDKKKDETEAGPAGSVSAPEAEADAEDGATNMVSEGAPVSHDGEAAPGAGDDGRSDAKSGGGMTQSIKDNVASGVEKAGAMAKGKSGGKYDDKIETGVQKAKDMLK
ncbi:hypothetical protein GCM10009839_91800 [Catenulispora yoronensis]|uniref:Uncharacterized protein n=1 Tax=Catenulispora yoronensis TaxID=450799 RepID=A0ABN2VLX1_9ACTN